MKEFETEIIQEHLKERVTAGELQPGQQVSDINLLDLVTFDNGSDLKLYINCFNESLRMQPPVFYSSSVAMSETVQCGPLEIRKGDNVSISMYNLCNNPNEWIEPKKFIPERFEPKSKYYLTPSGAKRNPFSFSPFLGGARICIGKTFVEAISKLVLPSLLHSFKFEFKDGVNPDEFDFPHNNLVCIWQPKIHIMISDRNPTYTVKCE